MRGKTGYLVLDKMCITTKRKEKIMNIKLNLNKGLQLKRKKTTKLKKIRRRMITVVMKTVKTFAFMSKNPMVHPN